MEYKDEIINLRIEPSYKESLLEKAKKQKMTLAKYCREKLTKDLVPYNKIGGLTSLGGSSKHVEVIKFSNYKIRFTIII